MMFALDRCVRMLSVAKYSARLGMLDSSRRKRMLSSP